MVRLPVKKNDPPPWRRIKVEGGGLWQHLLSVCKITKKRKNTQAIQGENEIFFIFLFFCSENYVYLQRVSKEAQDMIAQILLSNHHLTKRSESKPNLHLERTHSVDFNHSRLGACGEPDRSYGRGLRFSLYTKLVLAIVMKSINY